MYPRMRLARNLLKDDGIILISIGDNEVNNLKNICNEIFGEENFISQLVWRNGRTSASYYTNEHEYVLSYAKNKDTLKYFKFVGDELISDRTTKKPSAKNPISEISFPAGIDFESNDKIFPEKFGDKEPIEISEGELTAKDGKLKNPVKIKAAWAMADLIKSWLSGDDVVDQKGQKITRFFFKSNGYLQYEKEKGTIHPKTVIKDFSYKNSSSEMESLLGVSPFDFTKPVGLLEYLLSPILNEQCGNENIVLDFFAGSGSTGHAIFKLNNKWKWKNRFILVQLPEPITNDNKEQQIAYKFCVENKLKLNIAEISKHRLRKTIKKDLIKGSFKVLKLNKSNYKKWQDHRGGNIIELEKTLDLFNQNPLRDDWNKHKLLTEIMLLEGFPLDSTIEKTAYGKNEIYRIKTDELNQELLICMDEKIEENLIEELELNSKTTFICLDSAISNVNKLRLSDKGLIKTI